MLPFLSPPWLEQLSAVAGGQEVGSDAVVVQQLVTGGPDGDIAFVLEVDQSHLRARPGRDPKAVLTLTEAWETAVLIHRGELTVHAAFRAGLVKVRGDVRPLVAVAAGLAPLGPAAAALRERTSDA